MKLLAAAAVRAGRKIDVLVIVAAGGPEPAIVAMKERPRNKTLTFNLKKTVVIHDRCQNLVKSKLS